MATRWFQIFSVFFTINAVAAFRLDCAIDLRALKSPVAVYEYVKANAKDVWEQAVDLKLPPAKRMALATALAEIDPVETARRIDELHLSPAQHAQVAVRIAEANPQALIDYPQAIPKREDGRYAIAIAITRTSEEGRHAREIADLMGTVDPKQTDAANRALKLLNLLALPEPRRFEIALRMDSMGNSAFLKEHVGALQLSPEHRYDIARLYGPDALPILERFDLSRRQIADFFLEQISAYGKDKSLLPPALDRLKFTAAERKRLFQRAWQDRDRHLGPLLSQSDDHAFAALGDALGLTAREKADFMVWFYGNAPHNVRTHFYGPHGLSPLFTSDARQNERIFMAAFEGYATLSTSFDGGIRGALAKVVMTPEGRTNVMTELIRRGGIEGAEAGYLIQELRTHPELNANQRSNIVLEYLKNLTSWNSRPEAVIDLLDLVSKDKATAIKILSRLGVDVSPHLHKAKFDREERFQFVLDSARRHAKEVIDKVTNLGLNSQERFRLAREIAAWSPDLLAEGISRFDLNERQRFEIATEIAERSGERAHGQPHVLARLLTFNVQDPKMRYELAKRYVQKQGTFGSIDEAIRYMRLDPKLREPLSRIPFAQDPIEALSRDGIEIDENTPLDELTRQLKEYAKRHPDVLKPEYIDLVWDKVKKRETGLALLRHLYEQNDYDLQKPTPADSIELISRATGVDAKAIRAAGLSETRLGKIYEYLLDIRGNLHGAPFEGVAIDPALLKKDSFLATLQRLRDLLHISGNNDEAWKYVSDSLKLNQGLHSENIGAIAKRSEELITDAVKRAFEDDRLQLTYADFVKLREEWGDLEPIFTLIARYKGNPSWRDELPVIGKVFEAALSGKFENYKFEGDPRDATDRELARAQQAMLRTEEQRTEWRRIRSRVALFNPNGGTVTAYDPMPSAKALIAGQLNEHLMIAVGDRLEAVPADIDAVARAISENPDPMRAFEKLKGEAFTGRADPELARSLMAAGFQILKTSTNPETLRRTAIAMNAWANRLNLHADLRSDLRDLSNRLKPNRDVSKESIVFTTTMNDPKSLITIGDMVACSSCQNYRTGGVIGTLPGYVIDANVQAVASFNLTQSSFRRPADFTAVKQALESGLAVVATWNGGKRTVTFEIPNPGGQSTFITSNVTEQSYRRQMIKLGTTEDGAPGIFLERPYDSSIDSQSLMAQQVAALEHEIAAAIGGHHDRQITVAASRNPGGHYSDAGGGVVRTAYKVGGR